MAHFEKRFENRLCDRMAGQNEECFDPIPLQPLLGGRSPENRDFVERMRKKKVRSVTLIKPEVVLYTLEEDEGKTVYCMKVGHDSHRRYQANHSGPHLSDYLYRFRNGVIRILNLSCEHRVRIGLLLADRSMPVSILDQSKSVWVRKGSVEASFDLERADRIVYSRSADALYWPQMNEKGSWDIIMCSLSSRRQTTVISQVPECFLQTLRDEFVLLFRKHGALFVDYGWMRVTKRYNEKKSDLNQSIDSLASKSSNPHEDRNLRGFYWTPNSSTSPLVCLDNFQPTETETELKGFCHCKDSKSSKRRAFTSGAQMPPTETPVKTVVLYGNTVYKLTAQICTPLATIQIPAGFNDFKLMYLGRIIVLHNDYQIAGYMNSGTPVKTCHGEYLNAGYGIVCNTEGIFRIKMSEPRQRLEAEE
ncbi:uncharacterized protein LOC100907010 [Galendromus occidentalis]|uniref:Uncharacterized protein LOC100907010 n=1 Tax=Galendromus occidentalis TaxID=34638 RepID=A0AAJ6QMK5_9ACAR|nr:uncharacterized protein LOC100907010 [Galendromus occidentalis]